MGNVVLFLIRPGIIDLGAFCVELWSFYCSKRISVPMSYISFWEHWLLLRDWHILDQNIAYCCEIDVFLTPKSGKRWKIDGRQPNPGPADPPGVPRVGWNNPGGTPPPPPPDTFRSDFRPVGRFYARLPPVGGKRSDSNTPTWLEGSVDSKTCQNEHLKNTKMQQNKKYQNCKRGKIKSATKVAAF